LFVKGALLNDTKGVLVQQTKNVQAGRQIRFTNVREIVEMKTILKTYIYEAIEVEKAGLKVNFKKTTEFIIPEEFQNKLDEIPALRTAFHALTPGRQRGYIFYFSQPKQSKTRKSRVEKCMQQILNGKGLNDQYIRWENELDINFLSDKRFVDPVIVRPDEDLNIDITKFDQTKIGELIKLGQSKGIAAKIP
jgi:hypothetical protein